MALILNIETATAICSIALGKDGKTIYLKETDRPNSHSQVLGNYIKEALEINSLKAGDLDAVAVSSGPGSYTGLRIGISTAKGLCYALDLPLIAVPTLRGMAQRAYEKYPEADFYIPMIDARRMEVYAEVYKRNLDVYKAVAPVIIEEGSFSEILGRGKVIFSGDGAAKCKRVINSPNAIFLEEGLPSAKSMVVVAEEFYKRKRFEDTAYFEPFYLKAFQAKVSKIKGLQ